MPDYNITFKGKTGGMSGGAGKKAGGGSPVESAASIRQKTIQAQKQSESKAGNSTAQLSNSIKILTSSLEKLISSNKALIGALNRNGGGGHGGGAGGGAGGEALVGGATGLGASLPIVGAVLAVSAFTMQKIAQIGNAYIAEASKQAGSVGVGGFRRGYGMYDASQVGAGMKSYGMNKGKYSTGAMSEENKNALTVGGIFGSSADEVLGQSGTFEKAGTSYMKTAGMGAGAGIESQLPLFMSAIAGELEEAVKSGMNSSDMADDIAENMATLTTGTKDVNASINIAKSMASVTASGRKGQVSSMEDMMAWKASQKKMLSKLNDPKQRAEMLQDFDPEERKKLMDKKEISAEDLDNVGGAGTLTYLTKMQMRSQDNAETAIDVGGEYKGQYGTSMRAMRTAANISDATGGQLGVQGIRAAYGARKEYLTPKVGTEELLKKGAEVKESEAGKGVFRGNQRTDALLDVGKQFADVTLTVETALINFAKNGLGSATEALKQLAAMAKENKPVSNKVDTTKASSAKPEVVSRAKENSMRFFGGN